VRPALKRLLNKPAGSVRQRAWGFRAADWALPARIVSRRGARVLHGGAIGTGKNVRRGRK
jgi:hypothetical protein